MKLAFPAASSSRGERDKVATHLDTLRFNAMPAPLRKIAFQRFREIDTDNDNLLSYDELARFLARKGFSQAKTARLIEQADSTGSGRIRFKDFVLFSQSIWAGRPASMVRPVPEALPSLRPLTVQSARSTMHNSKREHALVGRVNASATTAPPRTAALRIGRPPQPPQRVHAMRSAPAASARAVMTMHDGMVLSSAWTDAADEGCRIDGHSATTTADSALHGPLRKSRRLLLLAAGTDSLRAVQPLLQSAVPAGAAISHILVQLLCALGLLPLSALQRDGEPKQAAVLQPQRNPQLPRQL